jgi:excisionase family DNA binding protein
VRYAARKDVASRSPFLVDMNTRLSPEDILTVQQVADRFHVSKSSIYQMTRFRDAPAIPRLPVRKVGRHLRFLAAEVDAWFLALPHHIPHQKRNWTRRH